MSHQGKAWALALSPSQASQHLGMGRARYAVKHAVRELCGALVAHTCLKKLGQACLMYGSGTSVAASSSYKTTPACWLPPEYITLKAGSLHNEFA